MYVCAHEHSLPLSLSLTHTICFSPFSFCEMFPFALPPPPLLLLLSFITDSWKVPKQQKEHIIYTMYMCQYIRMCVCVCVCVCVWCVHACVRVCCVQVCVHEHWMSINTLTHTSMHVRTYANYSVSLQLMNRHTWDRLFFLPTVRVALFGQEGDFTSDGGRLVREEREGASLRGVSSSLEGDGFGVGRSGNSGRTAGPGDTV